MKRTIKKNIAILAVLISAMGTTYGQLQQDLILSTYSNQSTIEATRSVTLKPGFSIPSGKTVLIRVTGEQMILQPDAIQNYILRTSYISETGGTGTADRMQDVQYFDGLGRLAQTVQGKASPSYRDIVTHQTYDNFGREDRSYLPYAVVVSSNGRYRPAAVTEQATFYNNGTVNSVVPIPAVSGTTPSFARPVYEASPLNRVLEQGFSGAAWQPSTSRTNVAGRTVVTEYTTNNAVAFGTLATTRRAARYSVGYDQYGDPTLVINAPYPAKELYVTVTKDENWAGGSSTFASRLNTTEEYTDKQGRVVLKRTFNVNTVGTTSTNEMLSTYYVYDDFGNLCYVLPPALTPDREVAITPTELAKYAYQYRYDMRQRLSQKKMPGSNYWQKMIYNAMDQVVIHQDGNKAADGAIYNIFYKYDALGRLVMKGTQKNGDLAWWDAQHAANGQAYPNHWEAPSTASGNVEGYTNRSMPVLPTATPALYEVMEVNYYDRYTGIPSLPNNESANYSAQVQGLQTAKKTRVIGASNVYLWTVYYYDALGRVAKEWSQHYKGGTVSGNTNTVEYTYNFVGQPTQMVQKLVTANALALTVTTKYSYDHRGRLIDTKKQVKNAADAAGPEVLIARNEYNEIGQRKRKNLHAKSDGSYAETITHSYNARGWGTILSAQLFSEKVFYDDSFYPQFNGNIGAQDWWRNGTYTGNYTYGYDNLNRLTSGTMPSGRKELLEYDMMGNIKGLTRDAGAKWVYAYDGNKLSTIKFGTTTYTYTHDPASGNMTRDGRNANTITYNYLNLPQTVAGTRAVTYTYSGSGEKLRAVNAGIARDYVKGTEWTAQGLELVQMEEGRITKNGTAFNYEYVLKDHLGNARAGFRVNSNGTIEANLLRDYYPFGMEHADATAVTPSPKNNYLYTGKELQDGLGQYDYGARFYDPVIGRLSAIDPKAELYFQIAPYAYAANTPVNAIDPDGRIVIFINGNHYDGSGGSSKYWRGVFVGSSYDDRKTYHPWAFDKAVMNHFNDNNSSLPASFNAYKDGALGGNAPSNGNLSVDSRISAGGQQGAKDAAILINSLARTNGVITESLKIIAHSMGAAYAKGYIQAIVDYAKKHPEQARGLSITEYDFASFQQNRLSAIDGTTLFQFDNKGDMVVGGLFGALFGGSKHAKQAGREENGSNDDVSSWGGHSLYYFMDAISTLEEGTYKFIKGQFVKQ